MSELLEPFDKKVPLSFLNLVGYSESDSSEELSELFARAQQSFRSPKFSQTEYKLRWLLNRWVRMLKLDVSDWRATLLLRGLFIEELSWRQLSYLLKLSEARVRALSLDCLLEEVSPDDLLNHPTRDCARNDLYLLDVVTRQTWTDRLGIYPLATFESHLGECERCRRVFDRTQKYRLALLGSRMIQIPPLLEWREPSMDEPRPSSFGWQRFPLSLRIFGSLGLVTLIFFGVISAPYLERYMKFSLRRTEVASVPQLRSEIKPDFDAAAPSSELKTALDDVESSAFAEESLSDSESFALIPQRILRFMEEKKREVTQRSEAPDEAKLPAPSVPPQTVPEVAVVQAPVKSEVPKPAPAPTASVGSSKIFFRWGARAQDPDRMSQKVLAWLVELKALNAGELEFGALYRGGRYFHFTLPKTEYAKLLANIKTLPLTNFTDSAAESDRTIPGDQSRIVFWIGPTDR